MRLCKISEETGEPPGELMVMATAFAPRVAKAALMFWRCNWVRLLSIPPDILTWGTIGYKIMFS
jgi:hypothetical protein